jgi:hypothetical protein
MLTSHANVHKIPKRTCYKEAQLWVRVSQWLLWICRKKKHLFMTASQSERAMSTSCTQFYSRFFEVFIESRSPSSARGASKERVEVSSYLYKDIPM